MCAVVHLFVQKSYGCIIDIVYYDCRFQGDKVSTTDGPSSSTSVAQAAEVLSDDNVDDDDDDDLDVDELDELEASLSRASLQINEPSDRV